MRRMIGVLLLIAAAVLPTAASAHRASDSYLRLDLDSFPATGRWDIALRDLDFAIGLDANQDGTITWGEVRRAHRRIEAYALPRLQITQSDSQCSAVPQAHLIENRSDVAYAVLQFELACPGVGGKVEVRYGLLFELDPTHRGIASIERRGQTHTTVFSPDNAHLKLEHENPDAGQVFVDYLREGIWHIWIGLDHVLFLVALLLPSVLLRDGHHWRAKAGFGPTMKDVLIVVSAFTASHSLALLLAVAGWVRIPAPIVEPVIAATVLLAALNNLFPVVALGRARFAFALGLIHGLGFANVLAGLGLPSASLAIALVGFNLGVEVGQFVLVVTFLPIAYLTRHTFGYRRFVLGGGSLAVAAVSIIWILERTLNWAILPV